MVATEVALQFGARARKLIINGPLPMSEETRREFLKYVQEAEIDFVYQPDGSHLQKAYAVRHEMYGEDADPKTITRYTAEQFQGYAPFWVGHHAAFLYDHKAALMQIEHPALILTNTGDQIYENALMAREMRPDFAYTALAGGGIDIVDQMPEEWADAVMEFLKD